MCGLFGWFKTETEFSRLDDMRHAVIVCILASENEKRGDHSWGLWTRDTEIMKGTGGITESGALVTAARGRFALAHTRFATTGARTKDNAHPFRFRHIIGAHNGMIENHATLNHAYGRALAVDSMHIFAHLAEGMPLSDIRGYGAITYDDLEDGVFRFGRWNDGVLSLARTAYGWIWSSERNALIEACKLAEVPIKRVWDLKEGKRYTLTPSGELRKEGSLGLKGASWSKGARYIDWDSVYDDARYDARFDRRETGHVIWSSDRMQATRDQRGSVIVPGAGTRSAPDARARARMDMHAREIAARHVLAGGAGTMSEEDIDALACALAEREASSTDDDPADRVTGQTLALATRATAVRDFEDDPTVQDGYTEEDDPTVQDGYTEEEEAY